MSRRRCRWRVVLVSRQSCSLPSGPPDTVNHVVTTNVVWGPTRVIKSPDTVNNVVTTNVLFSTNTSHQIITRSPLSCSRYRSPFVWRGLAILSTLELMSCGWALTRNTGLDLKSLCLKKMSMYTFPPLGSLSPRHAGVTRQNDSHTRTTPGFFRITRKNNNTRARNKTN